MPTERNRLLVTLRDEQRLTWRQIATQLQLSIARVHQIYKGTKEVLRREALPDNGTIEASPLSARAKNCMFNAGFNRSTTKADLIKRIDELRVGARYNPGKGIKNFGKKSLREIEAWLEVPPPQPGQRYEQCPHCGQTIRRQ